MKAIKRILLFAVVIIICTSFLKKEKFIENNDLFEIGAPGILPINNELFCDQSEIRNVDWREYEYWIGRVFGRYSEEFKNTVIDTLVWRDAGDCLEDYIYYYFRHPAYQHYPVVGVSQKQAELYSKWRSDRVFEYLLINLGIIDVDFDANRDTYFSIEKFFNSEIKTKTKNYKIDYYPYYSLPSIEESKLIIEYSDSIDQRYLDKCNSFFSKKCNRTKQNYPSYQLQIIPCLKDSFLTDPTISIHESYAQKFFHLRGNVAEWSNEENVAFGGGWEDDEEKIMANDITHHSNPSASIGFRNVFHWKKWER